MAGLQNRWITLLIPWLALQILSLVLQTPWLAHQIPWLALQIPGLLFPPPPGPHNSQVDFYKLLCFKGSSAPSGLLPTTISIHSKRFSGHWGPHNKWSRLFCLVPSALFYSVSLVLFVVVWRLVFLRHLSHLFLLGAICFPFSKAFGANFQFVSFWPSSHWLRTLFVRNSYGIMKVHRAVHYADKYWDPEGTAGFPLVISSSYISTNSACITVGYRCLNLMIFLLDKTKFKLRIFSF